MTGYLIDKAGPLAPDGSRIPCSCLTGGAILYFVVVIYGTALGWDIKSYNDASFLAESLPHVLLQSSDRAEVDDHRDERQQRLVEREAEGVVERFPLHRRQQHHQGRDHEEGDQHQVGLH